MFPKITEFFFSFFTKFNGINFGSVFLNRVNLLFSEASGGSCFKYFPKLKGRFPKLLNPKDFIDEIKVFEIAGNYQSTLTFYKVFCNIFNIVVGQIN